MTDNETQSEAKAREVLAEQYLAEGGRASIAEYLKTDDSPVIRVDTVIRAMLVFAKEAPPSASVEGEEVTAWKSRARSAANSIDALLLYATTYPADSHALDAYALLIQLRTELGMRGSPRTVDTFARNAAGRSVMPPLSPLPVPSAPQGDE